MFSEKMREIRLSRGFTIDSVAKSINVTRLTYGKWERGETSPKADQIPKIAEKLGVPIEALFEQEVRNKDNELKAYLAMIESLNTKNKEIVKEMIIALVHKTNAESIR